MDCWGIKPEEMKSLLLAGFSFFTSAIIFLTLCLSCFSLNNAFFNTSNPNPLPLSKGLILMLISNESSKLLTESNLTTPIGNCSVMPTYMMRLGLARVFWYQFEWSSHETRSLDLNIDLVIGSFLHSQIALEWERLAVTTSTFIGLKRKIYKFRREKIAS